MPQLDFIDTFLLILNYTVTNVFVFIFFVFYFFRFSQNFKFNIYISFLNIFYLVLSYIVFFHTWTLKANNRFNFTKLPVFITTISVNFFIFSPLEQFESELTIFSYFLFFFILFLIYFYWNSAFLFSEFRKLQNFNFNFGFSNETTNSSNASLLYSFLGYSYKVKTDKSANGLFLNTNTANNLKIQIDDNFFFFSNFLNLLKLNVLINQYQVYWFFFYFFYWLLTITTSNVVLCFGTSSLTEDIFICFLWSVIVNFGIFLIGLTNFGVYFFSFFLPSGAPLQLFFLLIIIETISYLIRFFSLAIRIFANMVSGGILMKILVGFSVYLFGLLSFASFGGVVLWVISFLILFLEFFVAGLQAYVFIFLSVVYLNEILHIGSH